MALHSKLKPSSPAWRGGQGAKLVRVVPAEMERQISSGVSTKNTLVLWHIYVRGKSDCAQCIGEIVLEWFIGV